MIDLHPPLILPGNWVAKRPAIIRPEVDAQRYFPVQINRVERRAVMAELLRQGRWDAMLPGMLPVIAGAASKDPSFANVSLLMHFDGANGSTTFTDSGPLGVTVTALGNAKISTAQSKFGGSSLLLDGAGDRLSLAAGTHFNFGTGAWTIEFWLRTTQTNPVWGISMNRGLDTATQFSWGFNFAGSGSMRLVERLTVKVEPTGTGFNNGNWNHIAITRSSNTVRMFVNGVQVTSYSTSYTFWDSTTAVIFGAQYSGSTGEDIDGYVDNLRITKGVARYAANFTPPSAPFPNYG